jgi:hypothetical protein
MSQIVFQKDFSRHPLHYFVLLCVELVGLWGIFWFSFQPMMQLAILVGMCAAYVVWGVIHHYEHRDLHVKIVFEYLLIAIFAVLVVGSLLFRS